MYKFILLLSVTGVLLAYLSIVYDTNLKRIHTAACGNNTYTGTIDAIVGNYITFNIDNAKVTVNKDVCKIYQLL